MKAKAIDLRIKKLVLDEPVSGALSAELLANAIRAELNAGEKRSGPLARAVAGGIGERLGAMNIGVGAKQSGGRHG